MRHILEECPRLRLRDVRAEIPPSALCATLQIGGQDVTVVSHPANLGGGYIYYFVCPNCEARRESLFRADLSDFRCRDCLGIRYSSSMKKVVKMAF